MRLGAQFQIQNSKFLIRTASAVRYGRLGFDKNLNPQSAYGRKPLSGLNKRLYIRSYENQFSTT